MDFLPVGRQFLADGIDVFPRGAVVGREGDLAGLDIAEFEYEGTFDDVSDSDPNVEYYQAVYEYGIFTGDDATGDLRPDDLINRAETTKVIMTAVEEVVETAEIEEKLDDVGTLLQRAAVLSKFFSLL